MSRRDTKKIKLGPKTYIKGGPNEYITTIAGIEYFVCRRDGVVYHTNRKLLRSMLSDLRTVANVQIDSLQDPHRECFSKVATMFGMLYSAKVLYDEAMKDVITAFKDLPNTTPGTVGAFLVGCYNQEGFEGPQGCHPSCIGSLTPSEGTPGFSYCPNLVLQYLGENESFSILNETPEESENCYIHIKDQKSFHGFRQEDINKLKVRNVKRVRLVFGSGNYKELTDFIEVGSLPMLGNKEKDITPTIVPESSNILNYILIGVAVFLVILFILAIFLLV